MVKQGRGTAGGCSSEGQYTRCQHSLNGLVVGIADVISWCSVLGMSVGVTMSGVSDGVHASDSLGIM